MIIRTIRRHVLPICCTAAFIAAAWLAIGLPIIAVCILDNASLGDATDALKTIIGVAAGISVGIMFPAACILERLAARAKPLVVVAPAGLIVVSIICLLSRFLLTGQFFDTVFGWAGLLFAISVIFGFYWVVLWLGRALSYGSLHLIPTALTALLGKVRGRWFAA